MRTMMSLRRVPRLGEAVFDDYSTLRCSSYYRHVYDLLGRTAVLVPFSAVPGLPVRRMFDSDEVFVRSDTNYKLFPAGVHAIAELDRWFRSYGKYRDERVVVSEVVIFEREYRCFCRDGRFSCGSSYPLEPYSQSLTTYVPSPRPRRRACSRMAPPWSRDAALCLVELGGVNSWGIYGSNVADFIDTMEAEAITPRGRVTKTLPLLGGSSNLFYRLSFVSSADGRSSSVSVFGSAQCPDCIVRE